MSGMRVDPRDRLGIYGDLRDTRVYGRTIAVLIPTLVESASGFDELHDSAIDPSSGDGLGRTATWAISNIYANTRTVDQALVTFGQAPPGSQVGDTFLTIGKRDYDMVLACLNNQDAYVAIDDGFYRPVAIQAAGIGQIEEYVVMLASFKPLFRAAGY